MPTRLRRAKDKEDIFQQLSDRTDKNDESPFILLKDAFLMAACVGYLHGKKEELKAVGEQIPWSVFSDDADQAIVNAIAFAETSDLNVLLTTEEQMERKFDIIEQYANGGIRILKERLLDTPGKTLDNLMDMIFENETKSSQASDKLTDFAANLF